MIRTHTSVCPHDCPDACSVRVGVEDGRIVSIGGDPQHPVTAGFLCGKVNRYAERVYNPQRILTPLRRIGAKGEGRFAPIGWNEALDEIAERWRGIIAEHGAQAILPYSYGGTIGQVGFYIGHRFFHALGATRLERTICTGASLQGLRMTMGYGVGTPLEDVAKAKLIVIWGLNAVATHVHLMPFVKRARAGGARLVVIDTYRNATARQADWFVRVRPGTDAALALGLMRQIIADDLHDTAFIDRYTHGFEELRAACAAYTPEHTEAITGVPAEEVVRLARAYGGERASFIRLGLGLSRHSNGAMNTRTIACLPALTGTWEAEGGGLLAYAWGSTWLNGKVLSAPHPEDPPARSVNMVRLGEALTELHDPPVRALYVYNSNPAAVVPEQARVLSGLRRDDLFTVVHEQVPTDTVDYADLVLPATTFMEHDDLLASYGHNHVQVSRAAIPPQGEARSNHAVFQALAGRLGLTDPTLALDFDSLVERLADSPAEEAQGLDREALRAGHPVRFRVPEAPWRKGLRTPSGRFEFVSERMAEQGLPTVPAFLPSDEGHLDNALRARYPLQLVTPPSQHFLNSSFGDTATSRKLERTPRIKLHPADAAARGLSDGAACRAFNDRGECFLTVEVTDDVGPGVAVAESIWWPKLHRGGKGINQLTSAELTDMGGCARFHDGLVQVEPAPAEPGS
ncbi:MAG TPA: molybdopterin oxidoreductase family protein [bacterium]|nr:molybdopterin oxidoreductase family protein [bacterium]